MHAIGNQGCKLNKNAKPVVPTKLEVLTSQLTQLGNKYIDIARQWDAQIKATEADPNIPDYAKAFRIQYAEQNRDLALQGAQQVQSQTLQTAFPQPGTKAGIVLQNGGIKQETGPSALGTGPPSTRLST